MCGTLADVLAKLLLAFAIFVALSHSLEADDQDGNRTLLPDVALLFHGPYGERSYELTSRSDGALTLQEVDNGPIRLDIRRISKMPCTFVSIHKIASGLIIEQLDLTQFDGTYQLWNACNPSGSLSEHNCTNSLHFNSQSNGYCPSVFQRPSARYRSRSVSEWCLPSIRHRESRKALLCQVHRCLAAHP
jgi:hypothetical protein